MKRWLILILLAGIPAYGQQIIQGNGTVTGAGLIKPVAAPVQTQFSLWPLTTVPGNINTSGTTPTLTLGIDFFSDNAGYAVGAKFWKAVNNSGTHLGNIWIVGNHISIGSVTYSNETTSGWEQATFGTPVPICPATHYITSYGFNTGHDYAQDLNYFTSQYDPGGGNPLHGVINSADNGNGIYNFGTAPAFPASTFSSSNYYSDVIFQNDALAQGVTAVSPPSGVVGSSATITGCGFVNGTTAVTVGGVSASIVVNSATSITVTLPNHATGAVDVVATTGARTATLPGSFTYTAPSTAPTLTAITPASAISNGGQTVTLTGTNFTGTPTVSFGGTAATVVTVLSSTSLTCVVPAHSVGSVSVSVTTSGGTSGTQPFTFGSILFQDNFETNATFSTGWGTIFQGTTTTNPPPCNRWLVETGTVHAGTHAAQIHYCLTSVGAPTANDNYLELTSQTNLTHWFERGYVQYHFNSGTTSDYERKLIANNSFVSGSPTYCAILDHWVAGQSGLYGLLCDNGPTPLATNQALAQNTWYSVEQETQLNTVGSSNGFIRIWLNGTLAGDFQNLDVRKIAGGSDGASNVNSIRFGSQAMISSGSLDEYRYWDDIVVADSYVGPNYIQPAPPSGSGLLSGCTVSATNTINFGVGGCPASLPAGYSLVNAVSFEDHTPGTGATLGMFNGAQIECTFAHTGSCAANTTVIKDDWTSQWASATFSGTKDSYISWWEFEPSTGLFNIDFGMAGVDFSNGGPVDRWWIDPNDPTSGGVLCNPGATPTQVTTNRFLLVFGTLGSQAYSHESGCLAPNAPTWGNWTQWEYHMKIGDANVDNGEAQLYRNGVLVMNIPPFSGLGGGFMVTTNYATKPHFLWVGGVSTSITWWKSTTHTLANCSTSPFGTDFIDSARPSTFSTADPCPNQAPPNGFWMNNVAGGLARYWDDIIALTK